MAGRRLRGRLQGVCVPRLLPSAQSLRPHTLPPCPLRLLLLLILRPLSRLLPGSLLQTPQAELLLTSNRHGVTRVVVLLLPLLPPPASAARHRLIQSLHIGIRFLGGLWNVLPNCFLAFLCD